MNQNKKNGGGCGCTKRGKGTGGLAAKKRVPRKKIKKKIFKK